MVSFLILDDSSLWSVSLLHSVGTQTILTEFGLETKAVLDMLSALRFCSISEKSVYFLSLNLFYNTKGGILKLSILNFTALKMLLLIFENFIHAFWLYSHSSPFPLLTLLTLPGSTVTHSQLHIIHTHTHVHAHIHTSHWVQFVLPIGTQVWGYPLTRLWVNLPGVTPLKPDSFSSKSYQLSTVPQLGVGSVDSELNKCLLLLIIKHLR